MALQLNPRKWCARGQVNSVLSGGPSGLEQAAGVIGNIIWLPGKNLTGCLDVQYVNEITYCRINATI